MKSTGHNGYASLLKVVSLCLAFHVQSSLTSAQTGITWTSRASPADNSWIGVTYGNNIFVAVGGSGTNRVMTSPDGITWTAGPSANDAHVWAAVVYAEGLFVAVGSRNSGSTSPTVMTSPDGIVWTNRPSADDASQWTALAYGNGRFVALAQAGTTRAMYSEDGITWMAGSAPVVNYTQATFGNGVFVGVGTGSSNGAVRSTDGITWTAVTTPAGTWQGTAYGNNTFVAVSGSTTGTRAMTSPDGITWTLRTTPYDNGWRVAKYGNGLFVALALNNLGGPANSRIMTSSDGIIWTSRTNPVDLTWRGLEYGNGMWVATAISGTGNRIMTSGTGTLPVKWVSFTIESINGKNELKWETATETDNARYEVQRSGDGVNFVNIGEVRPAPYTSNGASYFFIDDKFTSGTNYYRLKQVDLDGFFTFSKTVSVTSFVSFSLYPNPAGTSLTVKGVAEDDDRITYTITNLSGQRIQSGILPANRSISIQHLVNGSYILTIGKTIRSFIKQ